MIATVEILQRECPKRQDKGWTQYIHISFFVKSISRCFIPNPQPFKASLRGIVSNRVNPPSLQKFCFWSSDLHRQTKHEVLQASFRRAKALFELGDLEQAMADVTKVVPWRATRPVRPSSSLKAFGLRGF